MEDQIATILKNIKRREVRTFSDIIRIREEKLESICEEFSWYPLNEGKFDKLKSELDDYEYIEKKDIQRYDTIKFINMSIFYDLEFKEAQSISFTKEGNVNMKKGDYRFISRSNYNFRKLTNEDKVKISLIEAIYNEKTY